MDIPLNSLTKKIATDDMRRRPSLPRQGTSDFSVPMSTSASAMSASSAYAGSSRTHAPLLPLHRRGSAPMSPDARDMGGYFLNAPINASQRQERRASVFDTAVAAARRPSNAIGDYFTHVFYPSDDQLVEPFQFESVRTSYKSGLKLLVGLLGIAGYQLGGVLLVDSLFMVQGPPGVAPGVGAPRIGPDGLLPYAPPSVVIGATVFTVGIGLGLASAFMFLADGLRIAGNRKKAFIYVSMHLSGIVLISMSKFIIVWRKNHIPSNDFLALSLPGAIGRGIHFVTIPRSFSNSELRHGDAVRLSFSERQMASEVLRFAAAIFLGLWAGSWSLANYNPLAREGYSILASLALNLSAALPNTNLRRADIFRRSQTSLMSPQINSFRIGQGPRSPTSAHSQVSPSHSRPTSVAPSRPPLHPAMTFPMAQVLTMPPGAALRSTRPPAAAMVRSTSDSKASILARMPILHSPALDGAGLSSLPIVEQAIPSGQCTPRARYTASPDPLTRDPNVS